MNPPLISPGNLSVREAWERLFSFMSPYLFQVSEHSCSPTFPADGCAGVCTVCGKVTFRLMAVPS